MCFKAEDEEKRNEDETDGQVAPKTGASAVKETSTRSGYDILILLHFLIRTVSTSFGKYPTAPCQYKRTRLGVL